MTVVIGIDPHKASHTATAVGADLAEAATIRVRASRSMTEELPRWAQRWPGACDDPEAVSERLPATAVLDAGCTQVVEDHPPLSMVVGTIHRRQLRPP